MTPLEDAQAFVLESCPPGEPVTMRREQASGLVLADVVVSTEIVPPFNNSAVDGYAVRSVDVANVPTELTVVEKSLLVLRRMAMLVLARRFGS